METKRIGLLVPEELYTRLISYKEKTYEPTITHIILKAINDYISESTIGNTPMPTLLDSTQGPTYSKKIAEEIPTVFRESIKEEEPISPESFYEEEYERWEVQNILDLYNLDQSKSIILTEELPDVTEYLRTLIKDDLDFLNKKCGQYMAEKSFKDYAIENFIEWTKQKLEG